MTFGTFWCKLAPSFFWILARFSKLVSLPLGESQLNIKNDPNETDQILGPPCSEHYSDSSRHSRWKSVHWLRRWMVHHLLSSQPLYSSPLVNSGHTSPPLLLTHQAQSCSMALYCLFHLSVLLTLGIPESSSLPPLGFFHTLPLQWSLPCRWFKIISHTLSLQQSWILLPWLWIFLFTCHFLKYYTIYLLFTTFIVIRC